jgi:hypothetical protein
VCLVLSFGPADAVRADAPADHIKLVEPLVHLHGGIIPLLDDAATLWLRATKLVRGRTG